ncbi:MAG TPA: 4'-phosphopantetheinyl transferase superfamily protein [Pyrinomonadaceae bacterium]|jgi:4'-phosphopantetheinyl transferase
MGEQIKTVPYSIEAVWHAPPRRLSLARDEVHVWLIELAQPDAVVEGLARLLAERERERAGRFHFARDRRAFQVAKGATRQILAWYLNAEPRSLSFSEGAYGKPYLQSCDIRFNLSHSGGLALLAVAREREVGVDVEEVRELEDFAQIAERFFSPAESRKLRGVAGPASATAFFNCWTRKEAFIKAVGEGLSHPLDTFEVTFLPGEEVELRCEAPASGRWLLAPLPVPEGYAAALVVERHAPEGSAPTISRWRWRQSHPVRAEAD